MNITSVLAVPAITVVLAAPAQADEKQDAEFYRLLTTDEQHPMTVWDFPGIRGQGIAVCEKEDRGEPPHLAVKDLQYPNGPYSYDDAVSIATSAETVYCPSHTDESLPGGGRMMSTPIYPPPTYPPIMWTPTPLNYAR
jgi:hypothetical protein